MKTLYIIGNGFDLAHGLDTRYWKFREFLENKYHEFLFQFETLYNIQQIDESDPRIKKTDVERWKKAADSALWSKFEEKMGNPDIDAMMNFSDSILNDMNLDGGLVGIRDTMKYYWRDQYGYVQKFQEYVKEWIETIDTDSISVKRKSLVNSDDVFLTFNYTDVLEKTYGIEDVIHIHGGVSTVTNVPPIMGHCNKKDMADHRQWGLEADEEFLEGEASIHEAVVEYLESIFKDTEEIINFTSEFWKRLKQVDRVVILGWSAGEVDRPYLKKIKESIKSDSVWNYYWYSLEGKADIEEAFSQVGIAESYWSDMGQSDAFWDD